MGRPHAQYCLTVPGSYDVVKIGDVITRAYDKDPNALKPDVNLQAQAQAVRAQMQIQLADMENQQMMQGKEIPSTPYATPEHTKSHITFMQGEEFQQTPDQAITQLFVNHVTGELAAQEHRAGAAPQPGQAQLPPGGTQATSISQGIQNKPGEWQSLQLVCPMCCQGKIWVVEVLLYEIII
jgi:hypothetical protein